MRLASLIVVLAGCATAGAQVAVPNYATTTESTGTFLGQLSNAARHYQALIHADQLTAIIGQEINGITWRMPASGTTAWPVAETTYTDYDIFLGGSVDPSARSLTFANNIVGPQTQVRDGPLVFSPAAFPVTGTPTDWGVNIPTTPWLYTGGNLLITLQHSTSNGTNQSVESVLTSGTGYGTQFGATWSSSLTALTGSNGNFGVLQLTTASPVPEPSFLFGVAALAILGRRALRLRRR